MKELKLIDKDKHIYELLEPMIYFVGSKKTKVIVPKGFKTNLASVPKVLEGAIPHDGDYAKACVLHDYLYNKECVLGFNRYDSDRIFKTQMKKDGVDFVTRSALYLFVLGGGGLFFDYKKVNGEVAPNRVMLSEKETNPNYEEDRKEYREYRRKILEIYGKI